MKKLKPIFLAIIIGCTCAYFMFKSVEKNTLNDVNYNAVAVQIGVFKDSANATKMQEMYGGKVFKDEDVYRVYYSILKNTNNIEFITNYLSSNGINYYLRNIEVDESILDKSSEYEILMAKTNDESKLTINKELLSLYDEEVI
jgi:hypothetical protein